jgi:uncharacterized protein (DUF305 family)
MQKNTILIAIAALLFGSISGYVIGYNDRDWGHRDRDRDRQYEDQIPAGMHRMPDGSLMGNNDTNTTMSPSSHMMDMMVDNEKDFLEGMIPHHQEAVDTAKRVLERGATTPEIKTLVQNIITAQEAEIAQMKGWYQAWYGKTEDNYDGYHEMMRDLSSLSGTELDRVFLEDMIMHHMGAIMMANSVKPHIEHQEIETLTNNILSSQSEEIKQMRQYLSKL